MSTCPMCGALVSAEGLEKHQEWHVRLHDHDTTVLSCLDECVGALESISTLQDIDGERLAELEDR